MIDFQIKFSLSISGIVTHWFTLIVLSALRRSNNENMLSLVILILRQFHQQTYMLMEDEARVSREAWAHAMGCSAPVYYELQAYRAHTQIHDLRISSQEALTTTLVAQVSSL
nr:hypothetical protein [Tanacetum cinerariifolium]